MRLVCGLVAALLGAQVWALPSAQSLPLTTNIAGKVRKVVDGDTLHLVDEGRHLWVIRLTDIDAPETAHGGRRPGQPYANQSAEYLRQRALGREANLHCFDIDVRARADGSRRERYVCRVVVDGLDLSAGLVDAGLAMVARSNPRYVRDPLMYEREHQARTGKRGLWSEAAPVPPWVWRKACWEGGVCPGAEP